MSGQRMIKYHLCLALNSDLEEKVYAKLKQCFYSRTRQSLGISNFPKVVVPHKFLQSSNSL